MTYYLIYIFLISDSEEIFPFFHCGIQAKYGP